MIRLIPDRNPAIRYYQPISQPETLRVDGRVETLAPQAREKTGQPVTSLNNYSQALKESYENQYQIASTARAKGLDVSLKVESESTYDIAERVEKSVGPKGVSERIRQLNRSISREEIALKISEEIVLGRFGSMNEEEAAEQAVRTALAVLDEAVTVSPIQGIHDVKIRSNPDRTRHLTLYFAGPMRSAGGTEMGLILIVADHVRRVLGLQAYRATDQEARRFVEELRTYERHVNRFQYHNPDKLVYDTIARLPVEPNGVETDPIEVTVNRNLARVETNRVRGGALRVVNDGLLGRSQKILRIVDRLRLEGWDWLSTIKAPSTEGEEAREFMFMEDVVGGRPIFAFPGAAGGFRLRYGRARNTGLASIAAHPSTMEILGGFLAVGVQMRLEKPGKAGIVTAVDTIEPPVVKLKDGSVLRVDSPELAKELKPRIERVLFLGDLLIAYGEFLENNRTLVPSGYVEEWWSQELSSYLQKQDPSKTDLTRERLSELARDPFRSKPTAQEAVEISRTTGIPLHPSFSFFWNTINIEELGELRRRAVHQVMLGTSQIMRLPLEVKPMLERLCVTHRLENDEIVLDEDTSYILNILLGIRAERDVSHEPLTGDVESVLMQWAGFPVRSKTLAYVGARMGRPEKAKERSMTPKVHVLFPAGQLGGPRRDIVEASGKTVTSLEVISRVCPKCDRWEPRCICPRCGTSTIATRTCPRCGRISNDEMKCSVCTAETLAYRERNVDLRQIVAEAAKKCGMASPPETVKGVKGLTNKTRTPEPLEKGFLRARHDVSIFKDGTLRFDAVNAVLTHFRPSEVGLSPAQARGLGYEIDVEGQWVNRADQLIPLEVQDIVIPETCANYLLRVAGFLDDLLQSYYGLERFYNISQPKDLIGHLVVGLSPHTSVGIVGRILGFTRASVCYAHPLWHAAKRRDCDGDEDSVSLLLDVLLNFSREYLPDRIGGLMDAALLLSPLLNPNEVARQALNIEALDHFPAEFFEKSQHSAGPKDVDEMVLTLGKKISSDRSDLKIGFTHPTERLDRATLVSAYKELPTMLDKVKAQLDLADKIVAVKGDEVARKVLSTHILRDLVGNLRTYTSQRARCSKCNSKPRRVPLTGKCPRCGGKLGQTVFKSGVEKYLNVATEMLRRYKIGEYYEQRLELIKLELSQTFKPEDPHQQKLFIADYA